MRNYYSKETSEGIFSIYEINKQKGSISCISSGNKFNSTKKDIDEFLVKNNSKDKKDVISLVKEKFYNTRQASLFDLDIEDLDTVDNIVNYETDDEQTISDKVDLLIKGVSLNSTYKIDEVEINGKMLVIRSKYEKYFKFVGTKRIFDVRYYVVNVIKNKHSKESILKISCPNKKDLKAKLIEYINTLNY